MHTKMAAVHIAVPILHCPLGEVAGSAADLGRCRHAVGHGLRAAAAFHRAVGLSIPVARACGRGP